VLLENAPRCNRIRQEEEETVIQYIYSSIKARISNRSRTEYKGLLSRRKKGLKNDNKRKSKQSI
jgi:hypothetical protein